MRKRFDNTSGYPGVSWYKARGKWVARIMIKGKLFWLGYFDTLEEAIRARKAAELEHFGPQPPAIVYPDPGIPGVKIIQLTKGRVACVDADLFEWLSRWNWCYSDGYAKRDRLGLKMHVAIMKHVGLWKPNLEVDHRNGCGFDNRLENLRTATESQNSMNAGLRSTNVSGVTGVSYDKERQKWHAYIDKDGKRVCLGYHKTREEAIAARVAAEIEHYGEFRYDPTLLCPLWDTLCPDCAARAKQLGVAA